MVLLEPQPDPVPELERGDVLLRQLEAAGPVEDRELLADRPMVAVVGELSPAERLGDDNRFEMVASNHIKNFVEAFDDHDMPDIEDYEWIDDPKERKKEFDKDVKGWKKRQALLKPFEFEFKF